LGDGRYEVIVRRAWSARSPSVLAPGSTSSTDPEESVEDPR
jgi:hypothetical protein